MQIWCFWAGDESFFLPLSSTRNRGIRSGFPKSIYIFIPHALIDDRSSLPPFCHVWPLRVWLWLSKKSGHLSILTETRKLTTQTDGRRMEWAEMEIDFLNLRASFVPRFRCSSWAASIVGWGGGGRFLRPFPLIFCLKNLNIRASHLIYRIVLLQKQSSLSEFEVNGLEVRTIAIAETSFYLRSMKGFFLDF